MKTTHLKSQLQQVFIDFPQKRMLKLLFALGVIISSFFSTSVNLVAQDQIGDYRSAVDGGTWNSKSTWEVFSASGWQALGNGSVPSSESGQITIRNGFSIEISTGSTLTVDQLVIEAGGQLTLTGTNRTLVVADGIGTDLTVNGTLINGGNISPSSGATIVFNGDSRYNHVRNGGNIPAATWDPKSNCSLTGIAETVPTGLNQNFGNLIFNSAAIATALPFGNAEMMIQGNLEFRNTGTGSLNFNQDKLTIGADLILSGGILGLGSNDQSRTFEVGANFTMNGGSFNISDGTAGGILNVVGNFSHTAGTITHPVGVGTNSEINFNGTGLQTFTGGGAYSGAIDFNVQAGASLTFGDVEFTDLSGSTGDFTNFGTLMGNFPEPDNTDMDLEGLVLADGKALRNEGTVAPGNSVGTLVIIGDFISIGTLNMEIESPTTFDRIIVTGDADVTGTLAPEFVSYTPDPNDDFGLITAATYSGMISTLSVTPVSYSCTYTDNGGILEFQSILPIQLLSFTGRRVEDAIQLDWRTATEINNDYMAIERASHDFEFVEIGRVAGVGTTTEIQDYQFLDQQPLEGANYYRLRQVDIDGTIEYHPVIYVDFIERSQAAFLQIFPNPARDHIRAAWRAGNNQTAVLRLFSASGQLVQTYRVNGEQGTYELPVDKLAPGIYNLQMSQGSHSEHIRFIKH